MLQLWQGATRVGEEALPGGCTGPRGDGCYPGELSYHVNAVFLYRGRYLFAVTENHAGCQVEWTRHVTLHAATCTGIREVAVVGDRSAREDFPTLPVGLADSGQLTIAGHAYDWSADGCTLEPR